MYSVSIHSATCNVYLCIALFVHELSLADISKTFREKWKLVLDFHQAGLVVMEESVRE